MKKRVLATLLAMSMVLGLAACGSKSDSKDDKKEETKTLTSNTLDSSKIIISFYVIKIVHSIPPIIKTILHVIYWFYIIHFYFRFVKICKLIWYNGYRGETYG